MDQAKFVELLQGLQSTDNGTRQQAEKLYAQAKAGEPDALVVGLLTTVRSQGVAEGTRTHAAVLLRRLCMHGSAKDFAFARMTPQNKADVAAGLLATFEGEGNRKLQQKVGECVAVLAEYLCGDEGGASRGGWEALLPLVLRMGNTATNPSPDSAESALRLLKDLTPTLKDDIVGRQAELAQVLQNAVAHADVKLKTAALLFICEIVSAADKKQWWALTSTAPVLLAILQQLAGDPGTHELLQEALQAFVEVASIEPDFFKSQMSSSLQPAQFLAQLVTTRNEGVEPGIRNIALEWLITFVEKKPKWITKSLTALPSVVVEACMSMLLEVDGTEEDLREWAGRMDDEEGEEDDDELFHVGEESTDRVAEALGMECLGTALFGQIARYVQMDEWQAKHAALAVIKQTVEYVEDKTQVDEMARLLLQHLDHAHPRVRYTALHAIGQLSNDQSPHFQETWHKTVMPALLGKMDDPVDRVASMAMSAFVSFGEELDNTLMAGYSEGFMTKLVARLTTSSHRGVKEECITAIAVIAGVIEKDFSRYYDSIMPMLKQVMSNATGEKENRLRGKAFECISLLGMAVGKEKFHEDAKEAVAAMMRMPPLEADDVQREYIKEASERICKCLKRDFAPFLAALLPGILNSLKLEGGDGAATNDDDNEYLQVTMGEGKVVRVHSSKFEEMSQSVQLLQTFCEEMEGAYFDYVPMTAEAILPLLSATDDVSMLCDEARGAAFQVWALLIKVARVGAQERNVSSPLPRELLTTFLQRVLARMERDDDPETLQDSASGVSECLKGIGPGALNGAELLQLVQKIFTFIDQSFERSRKIESETAQLKAGAPAELEDDEDADYDGEKDEDTCRRALEDTLGAVMKVAPDEFMQCLGPCAERITTWLAGGKNKTLALYLACDLLEHLKERSESVWPVFMPEVFRCLRETDPEARTAAAYAVNLAAPLPRFGEAVPEAFRLLAQIVGGPTPKKRDQKGLIAHDNAVAALMMLAKEQPSLCPPEVQAWPLVVSKLPLRTDEEEAMKTHEVLVDLVLADHAGLLGPERSHLGKVLSFLAEVYHVEPICSKITEEKIQRIFKMIPPAHLQAVAGSLTEKQQKKIEKILAQ